MTINLKDLKAGDEVILRCGAIKKIHTINIGSYGWYDIRWDEEKIFTICYRIDGHYIGNDEHTLDIVGLAPTQGIDLSTLEVGDTVTLRNGFVGEVLHVKVSADRNVAYPYRVRIKNEGTNSYTRNGQYSLHFTPSQYDIIAITKGKDNTIMCDTNNGQHTYKIGDVKVTKEVWELHQKTLVPTFNNLTELLQELSQPQSKPYKDVVYNIQRFITTSYSRSVNFPVNGRCGAKFKVTVEKL